MMGMAWEPTCKIKDAMAIFLNEITRSQNDVDGYLEFAPDSPHLKDIMDYRFYNSLAYAALEKILKDHERPTHDN